MSTKHSPGPWKLGRLHPRDSYGPGRQRSIIDAAGDLVCTTAGYDDTKLDAANALLIATAPEFLDLLQRILRRAAKGAATRHEYTDGRGSLSGCSLSLDDIKAVHAAIAKTTGEEVTI